LRGNTWPGYALAGGVVIAALIALLVLTGGGSGPGDTLPPGPNDPGITRLFPSAGHVARKPAHHPHKRVTIAPGSSAAVGQYGVPGNGGMPLNSP
jgi:hypothetical protein